MSTNDSAILAYASLKELDVLTSPLATFKVIVWDDSGPGVIKTSNIADLPVSIEWGEITGTLANQTDLQAELTGLQAQITTNDSDIATINAEMSDDIVIKSFADLPAPVAGVITLVASTIYKWEALLDGTAEIPAVDQIILPDGGAVYSTGTASLVGFKSNSVKPAILIQNTTDSVSFPGSFRIENPSGTGLKIDNSAAFVTNKFILNCITGVEVVDSSFVALAQITPFLCTDGFKFSGTNAQSVNCTDCTPQLCSGIGFILDNSGGDVIIRNGDAVTTGDCISITGTYTEIDIESTALETAAGTCLSVTGTVTALVINQPRYQTVSGIGMDITGSTIDNLEINTGFIISIAGAAAFKGDAASANITLNAVVTGTVLGAPGGASLVGITKKDLKFNFSNCPGVADSKSIGGYYISTPVTTVIGGIGTWVDLAGVTTGVSTLERWSHTAGAGVNGAVLEYIDTEAVGKTAIATFSVKRTAGASNRVYEFALWRDQGAGFLELPESATQIDVGGSESNVTILAAEEIIAGDKYKVRVNNTATTDDIQATSGTLIINT